MENKPDSKADAAGQAEETPKVTSMVATDEKISANEADVTGSVPVVNSDNDLDPEEVFEVDLEADSGESVAPVNTAKKPILNAPNLLTIFRLIMVPVFLVFMVLGATSSKAVMSAIFIFVLAAITDKIDGYLARKWDMVTNFGKIVDPIADKALVLGAFIALSVFYDLYAWFTVLVIFREISVTLMRLFLLKHNIVLAANIGGKVKTVLQMVLVVVLLLGRFLNSASVGGVVGWFAVGLVILTFVITMLTGIDYFIVGIYRYQKLKEAELDAREANFNKEAPLIKADPKKVEEAERAEAEALRKSRQKPSVSFSDDADEEETPVDSIVKPAEDQVVKPELDSAEGQKDSSSELTNKGEEKKTRPAPVGADGKPRRPRPVGADGKPRRPRPAGAEGKPTEAAGKRPRPAGQRRPAPVGADGKPRRPRPVGADGKPHRPRPAGAEGKPTEAAGKRPRPAGQRRPASAGVSTAKPMPRPANPMQAPVRKRKRSATSGEGQGSNPSGAAVPKRTRPKGSSSVSGAKPTGSNTPETPAE